MNGIPINPSLYGYLGIDPRTVDIEDVKKRIQKKRIHMKGGDPLTSTPEEYATDIDKEEKKWSGLVRKLGLKVR